MKLKSIVTSLILIALVSLVSACSFFEEEPTPEPIPPSAVQQPQVVSAEAFVVPREEADLAFEIGGRVVAIEVQEGDQVTADQVLVQLENSSQRASVAEAEAGLSQAAAQLAEAEANLAQVKAPPTQEEIAQQQANLARAEAALADRLNGPTQEEIAQAEAGVRTAQAQLAEVLAGTRDEDLKAAAARLMRTQADVREAQDDYDQVRYGDPDDVLVVGVRLEKATLAYEEAQAEYDKLAKGPTKEQIDTARARVAEAEAALATTRAGATSEQIAQAQADVARAEADLANLRAGATDEQVAVAEAGVETAQANVESARARVDSAQVQLNKTELTAPFDGTVGSLNVDPGEMVQGGTNIISLGDTSQWQIETDDLTEIDVVEVQVGANVDISVDALPGEEFQGQVVRIQPKSETKAGDVTYTVLIDITEGDTARLRWGMTTFVDIEADSGIAR